MAELSPQIMDQFRDFQRKKRQSAIGKASQIVGGAAETMRTGRSAAATFADRAPEHDTMSRKEKLAASAPLIKSLGQEEQFYSGEARKERQAIFDQFMQSQRAVLQAQVSAMQEMGQSARTRAQLELRERLAFAGKNAEDRDLLRYGDVQTQALVKGSAGAAREELKDTRRDYETKAATQFASSHPGWDEMTSAQKKKAVGGAVDAHPDYQADVQAVTERYTNSLLAQERPPGQAAAGLELFSAEVGVDLETLAADNPEIAAMLAERDDLLTDKEAEIIDIWQEANEASGRTFGGNAGVAQASAAAADAAGAYQQAVVQTGQAPGGAGGIAAGQTGAPGEEDPNAQYTQVLGLPVAPATDSKRRTLQMLELIEEYPEHPPLIEARNQILNSPEFKKYQSDRNYDDPGVAFKVMKKEMRMKIRDDKRNALEQVREDLTSGRLNRAPRTPPKPPKAPVQGSAGRQAEVDSGGTD